MTKPTKRHVSLKAIALSRTIDTRTVCSALGKSVPLISSEPIVLNVHPGRKQNLMVLRYGVIVLINNSEIFERKAVSMMQPFLQETLPFQNSEELKITVDPNSQNRVLFNRVIVQKKDDKYWQILAMLLAQSVALEIYEKNVDQLLTHFSERLATLSTLSARILYPKTSEIIKNISQAISLHQDVIGNLEVLDKPDLTWEGSDLDKLYRDFSSMLELPERIAILEQKLSLLKDHMSTALNIVSARRMEILEIVIIILIALSIIQGLFALY
ncbi:MAG: RMD1 family protein [Deltaproteobacteria bacterium]|nr:RMD1 family protein [Deltaproteobacteria bacterium]